MQEAAALREAVRSFGRTPPSWCSIRRSKKGKPPAWQMTGTTRLLVVFDLANHESTRPRGLLGPECKVPGGAAPFNASSVYEFGEAWQAFSWSFPWPPALGVLETVEAYLGRFRDHR